MARQNTGLPMGKMPNKATFIYGQTGERQNTSTKKVKGGDLRSRPGKNNGRVS